MHPLGIRRTLAVSVLVALGLIAAVGCSSLPTAPVGDPSANTRVSPEFVRVAPSAGLLGGALDLLEGTVQAVTKTVKRITGSDGGSVTKGRFTVQIPAGAFNGDGDISVEVPDSTRLMVDLHITNVPNDFAVPVVLEVSVAGVEAENVDPNFLNIFWHDEAAGVWRQLPTTYDPQRKVVSTPLEHFSRYGVLEAKAGW